MIHSRVPFVCGGLLLLLWPGLHSSLVAQDSEPGIRLGATEESVWEFGMQVTARGPATGIQVTVPIPRSWPEQTVELVDTSATDGVSQLKTERNSKWTEQLEFRINRLAAGQTETAYYRLRIRKRMIEAPQDPTAYSIPERITPEVRPFTQPSPFIESRDRKIVDIAKSLRDESLSAWEQVETNFRWVRENVQYEFDTQIRSCLDALASGKGDCEELSSIFIAICRAQKIPARAVWIPDHTYPEFYLVDTGGNGHWFPAQAAGIYEFGAMTEGRPILQKGDRFKMPGNREWVRYLRPALVARDARGPIDIQFIRRQVDQEAGAETGISAGKQR